MTTLNDLRGELALARIPMVRLVPKNATASRPVFSGYFSD